MIVETDDRIAELLRSAKTIAVVGASSKPWRDSNSIMEFLRSSGYTVYPVNPTYTEVNGLRCYPSLHEIGAPIDIVNIFRRPDSVPSIIDDAIAAKSGAVWLQLGVNNESATARADHAGLSVVLDRCIAVEYRRLLRKIP